jgi:hypothetical protein
VGFGSWVLSNKVQAQEKANQQLQTKLQTTQKTAETRSKDLQSALKKKADAESALKLKEQEAAKKQQEIESLHQQLQAKLAAKANLAKATVPSPVRVAVSGTCNEWIAAAGIADVGNAQELIRRESGCNPNAINASSGACGIGQELPCGKSGCSLGDGLCQIRWMASYVAQRYGTFASAIAFHNAHGWY